MGPHFWWGLMVPGLQATCPRSTSSRLMPRTSSPTLSPACPWFRLFLNISTPVGAPCKGSTWFSARSASNEHTHMQNTAHTSRRVHGTVSSRTLLHIPKLAAGPLRMTQRSQRRDQHGGRTGDDGGGGRALDAHQLDVVAHLDDALLHSACDHRAAALQCDGSKLSR
jgi:hypothetical protein